MSIFLLQDLVFLKMKNNKINITNYEYFLNIFKYQFTKMLIISELLYIDHAHIYHLPSFSPATSCQVPPHPIPGLTRSVAGLSDGSLVICGGNVIMSYNYIYYI